MTTTWSQEHGNNRRGITTEKATRGPQQATTPQQPQADAHVKQGRIVDAKLSYIARVNR